MSSPKPKDAVYALVVISSVTRSSGNLTCMVDKLRIISDKSQISTYIPVLSKLATISMGLECEGTSTRQLPWDGERTPYTAKKARTLCYSPSDVSG